MTDYTLIAGAVLIAGILSAILIATYASRPEVTSSTLQLWDTSQLPLSIAISPEIIDLASYAVASAVEYWNSVIPGITFFTMSDEDSRYPQIEVLPGNIEDTDQSAHGSRAARVVRANYASHVFILVDRRRAKEDLQWVLAHELGHVLGLVDDPFLVSVMHKHVLWNGARVTSHDIALLKAAYSKEVTDEA